MFCWAGSGVTFTRSWRSGLNTENTVLSSAESTVIANVCPARARRIQRSDEPTATAHRVCIVGAGRELETPSSKFMVIGAATTVAMRMLFHRGEHRNCGNEHAANGSAA